MDAASGRAGSALIDQLSAEPSQFDFFQAVRLLQKDAAHRAGNPVNDRTDPRVGRDQSPEREAVRFRALPSLAFPASTIAEVRPAPVPQEGTGTTARSPEMIVTFLGLFGPQGVLPRHYTSLLIQRLRDKDAASQDFLDLFNHRLTSLFYRAWEKQRFYVGYEWARCHAPPGTADPFTQSLYSLVGLGTDGLRGHTRLPDEVLVHYAGHYAHFPRCAVSLERMLSDYFGVPARVKQFQGQWLMLEAGDRSRLPGPGLPRGQHARLTGELVVGERVWDVQSNFRICLGPLGYEEFREFLPEGTNLRPLCEMVRAYVGIEVDFAVEPSLQADQVPACRLASVGADRPRLGRNIWLCSLPVKQDRYDASFRLDDV
ncbi:MAG: type VI secretion system baseplate subunit TssG [Planctomycetota bacterium]|nr:type VI secretion system baseplate subunit TssG [Planctomycetota bacterium]